MPRTIYEYLDYREYLRDYYEFKKEQFKGFSYRIFSDKIGFKTKDFILRVIQGKRNLGTASLKNVAKGMGLNKSESKYFFSLVEFNQATTAPEREVAHEQMKKVLELVRFRSNLHLLQHYQYEVYAKWYVLVIRSLIGLKGFSGDYTLLASRVHPTITEEEVRYAVDLLLKCGLIAEDAMGHFALTQGDITTGDSVRKVAIKDYHHNCLRLAGEAMERDSADLRNLSALTLGISQGTYEEIIERLAEFRKEIALLASKDADADRVMQLNLQIFAVSQEKST